MSKWLKKDAYDMFAQNKKEEVDSVDTTQQNSFYRKWKNPQMGTQERAKEYTVRLLPDPNEGFYKNYKYHGFMSGEKFQYVLCEKTFDMNNYCAFCDANKILYQGNDADKKQAFKYKRQERYVGNVYIVDDPRDVDVKDEKYKVNGTVRLYEFPATVESKVSNEITDTENGFGMEIFDPENGYNFILKIKAKPKDQNGKEWPDYGDTMFARRPSAIADNDDGIERLMSDRYDLDEYIKSMRKTPDEIEKLLKQEMIWDDVSSNFERFVRGKVAEPVDTSSLDTPQATPQATPEPVVTEQAQAQAEAAPEPVANDDNTDALLAELENL